MDEVGEVEGAEIEVGEEGQHAHHPQDRVAHLRPREELSHAESCAAVRAGVGRRRLLARRLARTAHLAVPPQKDKPKAGQDKLPHDAGVVVPVVEQLLGRHRGDWRVHDFHRGRERRWHLAVGRDFRNGVEAVANALAELYVARDHAAHVEHAHAQAVVGHGIDLAEDLVVLAVDRPPDGIRVVGVGLNGERANGRDLAKIPGHGRRSGVEDDRGSGIPHRAFGGDRLVGEQAQVAPHVLPCHGLLVGQQVALGARRRR